MSHQSEMLSLLLSITEGCRPDMHEPDEQGLSARVVGTILDNAFGDHIFEDLPGRDYQEIVIVLERDGRVEKFNLASLIALARKAQV